MSMAVTLFVPYGYPHYLHRLFAMTGLIPHPTGNSRESCASKSVIWRYLVRKL